MLTDKFLTKRELLDIVDICEALDEVYLAINLKEVDTNIFRELDGTFKTFVILGGNGDIVGHIGMIEGGSFGLYLDNGEDE